MAVREQTDSRRAASAAYHERRKAEGWRKLAFWLDRDAQARLDELAKEYGSKDAALNALLTKK